MADTKVSALPAVSAAALANEIPVNEAGTSKKVTLQQVQNLLGSYKATLASDHAISSATATEVTLGVNALPAGTYVFEWYLLVRSATSSVSPMYGVNFTGTAAVRQIRLVYNDSGPLTAGTGVAQSVGATAGTPVSGQQVTAFSTTTPNLGHTGGVQTINVDNLVTIEGLMIVTATGDLELWHGSETATSTTIKAGSSLIVTRCG